MGIHDGNFVDLGMPSVRRYSPARRRIARGVGPRAVLEEDRSRANESALAPVRVSKELGVQPSSRVFES